MPQSAIAHREPSARDDFTIDQHWEAYSEEEHAVWRLLFERQAKLLAMNSWRGWTGLGSPPPASRISGA